MTRREVTLAGLQFYAPHGAYAHEQRDGQPFVVDLTVAYDFSRAARSNRLRDAVDYRRLYADVRRVMERETPFRLIEAMAETIGREVLGSHGEVTAVRVRVRKPWAPLGGISAGTEALFEMDREP